MSFYYSYYSYDHFGRLSSSVWKEAEVELLLNISRCFYFVIHRFLFVQHVLKKVFMSIRVGHQCGIDYKQSLFQ